MGQLAVMIGVSVGMQFLSALIGPTVQGPRLSDLSVTASTYGNPIPRLYGTARMGGNVIWSTPIKEKKHKSGKGMPSQATYTYSASFAVAFCVGPTSGITRVWADSKLIYGDNSGDQMKDLLEKVQAGSITVTQFVASSGLFKSKSKADTINFRVYDGDENQLPDSLIVADKGALATPAYRGLCYIVFEDLQLANYGNRIPSITCEVTKDFVGAAPRLNIIYNGSVPSVRGASIDWDDEVFYKFDQPSNALVTYDMNSHQEISRATMAYGQGEQWTISPNGGPVYCLDGDGNNCAAMWIMDPGTGQGQKWGHGNNGLGDEILEACVPWDPTTAPRFTRDGQIFPFYTLDALGDRTDYFLHVSVFGNYSIWTSAMTPCWIASPPFGDSVYNGWGNLLLGNVTANGTDLWWWTADANNGIRLHQQTVFPGDQGYVENQQTAVDCFGAVFYPWSFFIENDYQIGEVAGYQWFSPSFILHDPTDNSLNMVGDYCNKGNLPDGSGAIAAGFLKFSVDDKVVKLARVWDQPTDNAGVRILIGYCAPNSRLRGGKIGWLSSPPNAPDNANNWANLVDLTTGDITGFGFTDSSAAYGYMITLPNQASSGVWDDLTTSFWTDPIDQDAARYFFRSYGNGDTLANIVEDICEATTALTAADVDVSQLADIDVTGYVISNNSTAKDALQQLSQAYFFDGVESDNILKFVPRGGEPVASITEDDLGVVANETAAGVKETSTQEFELPMRITLNYYAIERDYQTGSQYAKRVANPVPSMYSPNLVKTELPIVMDADTAKQMADKMLKMAWTNRTQIATTLPWKWMLLDPTDVVNITSKKNIQYRVRIDKFDMGTDMTFQMTGVTERAASYVSTLKGDAGTIQIQNPAGAAPVNLLVINTPLLRDQDDTKGGGSLYYVGVTDKTAQPGSGAIIEDSKTGLDFTNVCEVADSAIVGTCQNTLGGTRSSESTDEINTLIVSLRNKQTSLEAITQDDMLAGGNAALVGNEIIQYRDAVLGADGFWHLSGLLRGRRGTTYAVNTHGNGEQFVVLDANVLETDLHTSDDYYATFAMKAVPPGTIDSDTPPVKVTFEPNDLKPYTPEAVQCVSTVDTSSGTPVATTTVTWDRRSRITATLSDRYSDVPYFEGQGPGAACKWQAFLGEDINDPAILAGTKTPMLSGTSMIYNPDGTFATLSAAIDFSNFTYPAGTRLSFVFRVWEVGFVDGFPKVVRFDAPMAEDGSFTGGTWAYSELY